MHVSITKGQGHWGSGGLPWGGRGSGWEGINGGKRRYVIL